MQINQALLQSKYQEYKITPSKKLRLHKPTVWTHHMGGWTTVINLVKEHFHSDEGTLFISAVEEVFSHGEVIKEPWVGFVHQVPRSGIKWYVDLERLVRHPAWKASLPYCKGLFTLSGYVKDYLQASNLPCPVARILYPTEDTGKKFSFEQFREQQQYKLVAVGEFLRNHQAMFDLPAGPYEKILLRPDGFNESDYTNTSTVSILDRVSNDEYESLISNNLVFLNLFDAPANTTIIECIVRNTPVLVNKLPGVVEYLGEGYPFYYEDLNDAAFKATDLELIKQTTSYLETIDIKQFLQPEMFLVQLQNSAIYRQLPVPNEQAGAFRQFDVSLIICSYNRVNNIPNILSRLLEQDFDGSFEVILWNNNGQKTAELEAACADFKQRMALTVIHSSQNFYCIIRLAAASLIKSEVLLIVDDDVVPGADYVSTFMAKHQEYGLRSVLCCRGHQFHPHVLDEENPQRFWQDYEYMTFYDETVEDRQVHFFHADNCLLPKALVKEAAVYEMEHPEFALVDDYWLSYIISHKLQAPIWKFRADHIFQFTDSANDPSVALFLNPKVEEQRINFYLHHMRNGWPYALPSANEQIKYNASEPRWLSPEVVWNKGFRGVNMFSESPDHVFRAAAAAGIKVVRFGATGDAQDLSYLVNADRTSAVVNDQTLSRLKNALYKAQEHGLYAIITLTHLPGRNFKSPDGPDLRLWEDEAFQDELVSLWGSLAKVLVDFPNVIGYDLINEPLLPEEAWISSFDESERQQVRMLENLYERIVEEIRIHDKQKLVVLEASFWAKPDALTALYPLKDELLVYSFHMYSPDILTNRSKNRGRLSYPGLVPAYTNFDKWVECEYWDKQSMAKIMQYIADWQMDHRIPSSRIYLGEFGISREINGAVNYLRDIMDICDEHGWNWTIYAFREEAWDAMNYEFGTDMNNMMHEFENPLYTEISKRFK